MRKLVFGGLQPVKTQTGLFSCRDYCKTLKTSDTQTDCCNHPKIVTMCFYHRITCQEDADGMANSVDPDQTAPLGLHCLLRPVCPKT